MDFHFRGLGIITPLYAIWLAFGLLALYCGADPAILFFVFGTAFAMSILISWYTSSKDPYFPRSFGSRYDLAEWFFNAPDTSMFIPLFLWSLLFGVLSIAGLVASVLRVYGLLHWGLQHNLPLTPSP